MKLPYYTSKSTIKFTDSSKAVIVAKHHYIEKSLAFKAS